MQSLGRKNHFFPTKTSKIFYKENYLCTVYTSGSQPVLHVHWLRGLRVHSMKVK